MDKKFEKLLITTMICAVLALPVLYHLDAYAEADSSVQIEEGLISSDGIINQHPGIMRFHVIANSNDEKDQEIKLVVRNYVLAKVQNEIVQAINEASRDTTEETLDKTSEDIAESKIMREYIKNNLSRISGWAQEVLDTAGFDYKAIASTGIRHIPAKYYDDLLFPEGNYEALTITLGEGDGENWWCVVFPPLCLIDSEDSSYSEDLNISEEDRLVLKFKTEELLDFHRSQDGVSLKIFYEALEKSVEKSADFLLCFYSAT